MDVPNITVLSNLKVGDIFQFDPLDQEIVKEGEVTPQWRVASIGPDFCTATLQCVVDSPSIPPFGSNLITVASQSSVLHFKQKTSQ